MTLSLSALAERERLNVAGRGAEQLARAEVGERFLDRVQLALLDGHHLLAIRRIDVDDGLFSAGAGVADVQFHLAFRLGFLDQRDDLGRRIETVLLGIVDDIRLAIESCLRDLVNEAIDSRAVGVVVARLDDAPFPAAAVADEHELLGVRLGALDLDASDVILLDGAGLIVQARQYIVAALRVRRTHEDGNDERGENDGEEAEQEVGGFEIHDYLTRRPKVRASGVAQRPECLAPALYATPLALSLRGWGIVTSHPSAGARPRRRRPAPARPAP